MDSTIAQPRASPPDETATAANCDVPGKDKLYTPLGTTGRNFRLIELSPYIADNTLQ
jgi:hypothetical protein